MRMIRTSVGKLWVGSKDDVLEMLDCRQREIFTVIWNLAEELEFLIADECKYASMVCRGGIKDMSVPQDKDLWKFDNQLNMTIKVLRNGGKVLIHCWEGCGRTGMLAAIIKKKLDGISSEEALKIAKEYCDGPESKVQEDFVRAA